jgi:hypothetical protein
MEAKLNKVAGLNNTQACPSSHNTQACPSSHSVVVALRRLYSTYVYTSTPTPPCPLPLSAHTCAITLYSQSAKLNVKTCRPQFPKGWQSLLILRVNNFTLPTDGMLRRQVTLLFITTALFFTLSKKLRPMKRIYCRQTDLVACLP